MATLTERARATAWLSTVGSARLPAPNVVRPSCEVWRGFVRSAWQAELTTGQAEASPLDGFHWLSADGGPNPNEELTSRMASLPDRLREDRLGVTREVLRALVDPPKSPWLVIGAIDLRGAVRASAAHAFRMAASEVYFGVPGFWQRVVELYEAGGWPAAVDDRERILVV